MFGAFKKLFTKPEIPPAAAPPAPAPAPPPPKPAAAPPTAPKPAPAAVHSPSGDLIALPLDDILARLPNELAALVLSQPGGTIPLSASFAMEQLRAGAVRIPFSQLRQSAPPGTFAENTSFDRTPVDLPLPLVLAAIKPGGLARRPDQKRIEVPDDVTGVFGAKHGQVPRPAPPTPKPEPIAPAPPPPSPPAPVATAPAPVPTPIAPKPIAPIMPKPVAPIAPTIPSAKPTTAISSSPPASKTPAPLPFAAPKTSSPLPFATARPAPPPAAPAAPAVSTGETVTVTIEAVFAAWPDPVRAEVQQFDLANASLSIPLSRLEQGMKSGRVTFTWAELCGWLSAPMPSSANGESQVDLPLKVMAPLFLAKHRSAAPRKVVSVGENVPNLFAGLARPPAAAAASAPAPAAAPTLAPAPSMPAPAPNIFGEIFGDLSKTIWPPQEITRRILALPGVAGALLASSDGLLVAGQMPAPLKAETMAAFLPQIFTRVASSTEEAQLGLLRALRISAGPAPCAIFKAGALYLAVLGKPGETMPEPMLERIADALSRPLH